MADVDNGTSIDTYRAGLHAEKADAEQVGDAERVAAVDAELARIDGAPVLETATLPGPVEFA